MSANIDYSKGYAAIALAGTPAWHNTGTVAKKLTTGLRGDTPEDAASALKEGGMDFTVIKLPNVHLIPSGLDQDGKPQFTEIVSEDSFFTYRDDTNKILGSRLGRDYEPLQNHEALAVVDEILANDTATIETVGCIDEGRKVFICLKIKQDIVVGVGDVIEQYILIATSHDGSLSITAMPTNVRVVCQNTLGAALRKAQGKIKIRHTSGAQGRLYEAAKVLKLISENTEINQANYNQMLATRIEKEDMWNYIGNLFLKPQQIAELQHGKKDAVSTKMKNMMDEVAYHSLNGKGFDKTVLDKSLTMWTAYNGVTSWVANKKFETASERADSMLFGYNAQLIERAGNLALEPEKILPLSKSILADTFNLN